MSSRQRRLLHDKQLFKSKKGRQRTWHVVMCASDTERTDIDAAAEPMHSHLPFACSLCSSGLPG